jgi:hypothetical protein
MKDIEEKAKLLPDPSMGEKIDSLSRDTVEFAQHYDPGLCTQIYELCRRYVLN